MRTQASGRYALVPSFMVVALLPAMTMSSSTLSMDVLTNAELASVKIAVHANTAYFATENLGVISGYRKGMSLSSLRDVRLRLERRFEAVKAALTDVEQISASRAISEALRLLNIAGYKEGLWCDMNDEGVVLLRWRKSLNKGVLVLFQGDGTYTISSKGTERFYFEGIKSHDIADDADDLRGMLASI